MSIGNRVFLRRDISGLKYLEEFRKYPTANLADCMGRLYTLPSEIKLVSSPKKSIVAGLALTVKCASGDNLMIHQALNMAGEDDIIIASNEGGRNRSLMGEIMITHVHKVCKAEALILDSPVRDIEELSKMDFHIYATGSNPAGPYKEGPGEVNVPIAIDRTSISPGDIIVADADGVVIIPLSDAQEVLDAVEEYAKKDQGKLQATINGTINRDWVLKNLEEKNVEIINEYYGG